MRRLLSLERQDGDVYEFHTMSVVADHYMWRDQDLIPRGRP